jgi:DinB superfamily
MAEAVEQYITRLLGNVKGKDPVRILRDTPRLLAELIHAHTADSLRKPPASGKWSVSEILAHLSETELAAAWRYRQMLEHSGTNIIPYDQDLWAQWSDYSTCDPKESLEQFRLIRERNLKLLSRLSPEQWEKYGIHGERGKETVRRLAEMAAGHDINHLQQIEKILSA